MVLLLCGAGGCGERHRVPPARCSRDTPDGPRTAGAAPAQISRDTQLGPPGQNLGRAGREEGSEAGGPGWGWDPLQHPQIHEPPSGFWDLLCSGTAPAPTPDLEPALPSRGFSPEGAKGLNPLPPRARAAPLGPELPEIRDRSQQTARPGLGRSRAVNPSTVCANSHRAECSLRALQGMETLGKPWKSGSRGCRGCRGCSSTATMEYPECGWTEQPRREPGPAGKAAASPGARDVPAGITRGHPGSRKGLGNVTSGECLEKSTFPPRVPSAAAAAGSDTEGKDRNEEKGKSRSSESARDTPARLQPGTASPSQRKWNRDEILERSCSIVSPGIPSPAPGTGIGIGLICTNAHWDGANLLQEIPAKPKALGKTGFGQG